MRLLIATKNSGKFSEIAEVLKVLPIELVSLKEENLLDDVLETGATHEENAVLKARHFYRKSKIPTIGEDSGIHVDAFPDELGIRTRRFRGMHEATDEEWIKFFLDEMKGFSDSERGATFVCTAALIFNEASFASPQIFRGETRGHITKKIEASIREGIPLSSCFLPDGATKVYAALDSKEKNKISHRGKAIGLMRDFLLSKVL